MRRNSAEFLVSLVKEMSCKFKKFEYLFGKDNGDDFKQEIAEVILKIIRRYPSKRKKELAALSYIAVRNYLIDKTKSRKRFDRKAKFVGLEEVTLGYSQDFTKKLTLPDVIKYVEGTLSDEEWEILNVVLSFRGYSADDLASRIGVSSSTFSKRFSALCESLSSVSSRLNLQ